ncbi:SDR family oxidoreductase [Polynucleobacter sp. IMCC 30228]|uniref:SDR family NAD(P)-dependent oxidoreductase n=1 Tax=Polynucleobacter sp. IMCC 30228 TaxID=2781011 RepID=UPI001F34DA27|nr:SDR family oxidoreductase [Polynucleobacter sp. IMCC 30228]MCE7527842.1 SDR family oxidoreductase [Polynucleobacter sp. IMCC 30228]
MKKTAIIIGISSDIGYELAVRLAKDGWEIWGTYRTKPSFSFPKGINIFPCDVLDISTRHSFLQHLKKNNISWDLFIIATGTEEPIGNFWDSSEEVWNESIRVNALAPLGMIRDLYLLRNTAQISSVVFFSGSGTNNAAPAYSAYCASKIMLIKMCELLDAETPDIQFFIIGPGIVRTKIHEQTLKEPIKSGPNYLKLMKFLDSGSPGTSHQEIFECLMWCMHQGKAVIGGRNISLVYDAWRVDGGVSLSNALKEDLDMYKLRRFGNDINVNMDKI